MKITVQPDRMGSLHVFAGHVLDNIGGTRDLPTVDDEQSSIYLQEGGPVADFLEYANLSLDCTEALDRGWPIETYVTGYECMFPEC